MLHALVSIDPGNDTGFAVFTMQTSVPEVPGSWVFRTAGLARTKCSGVSDIATDLRAQVRDRVARALWSFGMHPGMVPMVACEFMVYRPEDSRSVVSDLFQVQAIGASIAGAIGSPIQFLRPDQWKASVPKSIMSDRIIARLSADEARQLSRDLDSVAGALHHNVFDAVGIGLYATGRMKRGGA